MAEGPAHGKEGPVHSSAPEKDEQEVAPACRQYQKWTMSGHPIVDRKYLDSSGMIREIDEDEAVTFGPPMIHVYWNNMSCSERRDHFIGFRGVFDGTVTEYLTRLGELLAKGKVTIYSVNASEYAVTIILQTMLSRDELASLRMEHKL